MCPFAQPKLEMVDTFYVRTYLVHLYCRSCGICFVIGGFYPFHISSFWWSPPSRVYIGWWHWFLRPIKLCSVVLGTKLLLCMNTNDVCLRWTMNDRLHVPSCEHVAFPEQWLVLLTTKRLHF